MTESSGLPSYNKIVLASDGSEFAWNAAQHALALAKQMNSEVVALFVVNPHEAFSAGIHAAEARAEMAAQGTRALRRIAELARSLQVSVRTDLLEGDPKTTLVEVAAQEGADCLVVGSHGTSGLERALLGSVLEYCVRHAPCPVLVVRPRKLSNP